MFHGCSITKAAYSAIFAIALSQNTMAMTNLSFFRVKSEPGLKTSLGRKGEVTLNIGM